MFWDRARLPVSGVASEINSLLQLLTRSPVYKKRSKSVTSLDFAFLSIFCTVVSYFQRRNVDSRFFLVPMFLAIFI